MTLLETAQGLEGEALDTWLESLSTKEKRELWVQCTEAVLEVLSRIVGVFGLSIQEASDGKVSGDDE